MNEETKNRYIEEINELLESRHKDIFANYPQIRYAYLTPYEGDTELNPVRYEISTCLILGLYQAALTLTNNLMEKYLKVALIYHNADFTDTGDTIPEKLIGITRKSTADYNSTNLNANINAACEQGIISEEDKKKLQEFRENFRNAYSHADAAKTFTNKSIPIMGGQLTENGLLIGPPNDAMIALLPILQGFAQKEHAEANAIPYFLFIDSLIRRTRPNIFKHNKDNSLK